MTNETPHRVMIPHEENIQSLRVGTEEDAQLQAGPAFKDILPQPTDRDSCVPVRPKEVGKDSQRLFHPVRVRLAQFSERGKKARAEQDGGPRRAENSNALSTLVVWQAMEYFQAMKREEIIRNIYGLDAEMAALAEQYGLLSDDFFRLLC